MRVTPYRILVLIVALSIFSFLAWFNMAFFKGWYTNGSFGHFLSFLSICFSVFIVGQCCIFSMLFFKDEIDDFGHKELFTIGRKEKKEFNHEKASELIDIIANNDLADESRAWAEKELREMHK